MGRFKHTTAQRVQDILSFNVIRGSSSLAVGTLTCEPELRGLCLSARELP
jgi:hypothetical protein